MNLFLVERIELLHPYDCNVRACTIFDKIVIDFSSAKNQTLDVFRSFRIVNYFLKLSSCKLLRSAQGRGIAEKSLRDFL